MISKLDSRSTEGRSSNAAHCGGALPGRAADEYSGGWRPGETAAFGTVVRAGCRFRGARPGFAKGRASRGSSAGSNGRWHPCRDQSWHDPRAATGLSGCPGSGRLPDCDHDYSNVRCIVCAWLANFSCRCLCDHRGEQCARMVDEPVAVVPGTTGVWGSSPGAASAMVVMADAFGADARLVAFMQYLRVVCVVVVASLIARFWVHTPMLRSRRSFGFRKSNGSLLPGPLRSRASARSQGAFCGFQPERCWCRSWQSRRSLVWIHLDRIARMAARDCLCFDRLDHRPWVHCRSAGACFPGASANSAIDRAVDRFLRRPCLCLDMDARRGSADGLSCNQPRRSRFRRDHRGFEQGRSLIRDSAPDGSLFVMVAIAPPVAHAIARRMTKTPCLNAEALGGRQP